MINKFLTKGFIIYFFISLVCFFIFRLYYTGLLFMVASILFFIIGYIRSGFIWSAFNSVKKNDFERAEKFINLTFKPELLNSVSRGYFHWAKGLINLKKGNREKAELELITSLKYNFRTKNDFAIVNITLAEFYTNNKDKENAKFYLEQATNIPHKKELDFVIAKLFKKIEDLSI